MSKKKKRSWKTSARHMSKAAAVTAAIVPLAIQSPLIVASSHAVAQFPPSTDVPSLGDYVQSQIEDQLGGSLSVGESITIDLDEVFEDSEQLEFMVINHNSRVADVRMVSGDLRISGKQAGSSMVELFGHPNGDLQQFPVHDQFRIQVEAGNLITDPDGDGIGINDLVRYMKNSPGKTLEREDLSILLESISTSSASVNYAPEPGSYESFSVKLKQGEWLTLDLNDFFFDPEGDELTYSVYGLESGSLVDFTLAEGKLSIKALSESARDMSFYVTATDRPAGSYTASKSFSLVVDPAEPGSESGQMNFWLTTNQELTINLKEVFGNLESETFQVYSVDGTPLESNSSYTVSFSEATGVFNIKNICEDNVTFTHTFKAAENVDAEALATTTISVTMVPVSTPVQYVQDGITLDLANQFSEIFFPYEWDDQFQGYQFELTYASMPLSWLYQDEQNQWQVAPGSNGFYEDELFTAYASYNQLFTIKQSVTIAVGSPVSILPSAIGKTWELEAFNDGGIIVVDEIYLKSYDDGDEQHEGIFHDPHGFIKEYVINHSFDEGFPDSVYSLNDNESYSIIPEVPFYGDRLQFYGYHPQAFQPIVITAHDRFGGKHTYTLNITTAFANNQFPTLKSQYANRIPDVSLLLSGEAEIDLLQFFEDADGDEMTFDFYNMNDNIVSAVLDGSTLTIQSVSPGEGQICIEVKDDLGSNEYTLQVNVLSGDENTVQELAFEAGAGSQNVDLTAYFGEAFMGDLLSYQVLDEQGYETTDLSGLFEVSIAGNMLTITPTATEGTVTFVVVGTNGAGTEVRYTFTAEYY